MEIAFPSLKLGPQQLGVTGPLHRPYNPTSRGAGYNGPLCEDPPPSTRHRVTAAPDQQPRSQPTPTNRTNEANRERSYLHNHCNKKTYKNPGCWDFHHLLDNVFNTENGMYCTGVFCVNVNTPVRSSVGNPMNSHQEVSTSCDMRVYPKCSGSDSHLAIRGGYESKKLEIIEISPAVIKL